MEQCIVLKLVLLSANLVCIQKRTERSVLLRNITDYITEITEPKENA